MHAQKYKVATGLFIAALFEIVTKSSNNLNIH
jgi:hypothetical protein